MQVRTAFVALLLVSTTATAAPATVGEEPSRASSARGAPLAPDTSPSARLGFASSAMTVDALANGPLVPKHGGLAQMDPAPEPTGGTTTEPTRTNLTVRLRPNGDARWTVTVAVELSGANETRAFRELAERYEAGRAEVGPSVVPFKRALAATSTGVEREMALIERSRSARIENDTGYLALRFVWTNFAETSEGRLQVGDAFRTPQGTWLPGLTANQTLVFLGPPGYGVSSAPIGPSGGTLRWDGPVDFEPDSLTITYRRGFRATTTRTTTPPADTGVNFAPLAGIAALGVGLLLLLYVRSQGVALPDTGSGATDGSAGSDGAVGSGGEGTEGDAPRGTDGTDPTVGEDVGDGSAAAGIDTDLLSDEERVERLLDANGGRMRQADIVTETRWSNAKVSQLLSAMDRAGRVEKLRIGRENLISLPDENPADADSTTEE
ncbi:hypothetical protein BRC77_13685 [Halobacteriales archaeon QH_8_64_26]|nr:MAG: hypothetical protein BRC77_13685 [Halobacteriales archaeon QH_8_64_26]